VRGSHDWKSLGLIHPRGVTIDGAGRIVVADEGQASLIVFDRDFRPAGRLLTIETEPDRNAPFRPTDVRTGPDGGIYTYDGTTGRARRYTPDGKIVGTWGTLPRDGRLAVAPDGSFWINAGAGSRLWRFGPDGRRIAEYGPGFAGGGGEAIRNLAIDSRGLIHIAWRSQNVITYRLMD